MAIKTSNNAGKGAKPSVAGTVRRSATPPAVATQNPAEPQTTALEPQTTALEPQKPKPLAPPAQQQKGLLPAAPAELAETYKEDAAENLANVHDAFYRISIEGGRYKVAGQLIGNQGIQFDAVILREVPVNVFYMSKYDPANPVNPDCWSLGGYAPDVACEHIQSPTCAPCPKNKFGTGTDAEGKRSKGKACRNSRRIVLKIDGVDLPVLMGIPPTALKAFNQYLKMLSSNEPPVPMFACLTSFGFDTTVQFPKPTFDFKGYVPADEYLTIREYRLGPEVEGALSAYASPDDVAAGSPDGVEGEETAQGRMEKNEEF